MNATGRHTRVIVVKQRVLYIRAHRRKFTWREFSQIVLANVWSTPLSLYFVPAKHVRKTG